MRRRYLVLLFKIINIPVVFGYHYSVRTFDNHVVHVVEIQPNDYEMQLVKGYERVTGRETVEAMAHRSHALIAINGGFFEMGFPNDGRPSGNLIINGKIYGLQKGSAVVIEKNEFGHLALRFMTVQFFLQVDQEQIAINAVNQAPEEDEVILFTDAYGPSSLINKKGRSECLFDAQGNCTAYHDRGNNSIPSEGYVVSLPSTIVTKKTDLRHVKLRIIPDVASQKKVSIISGTPLLLYGGEVVKELEKKTSDFYQKPHARTALGFRSNKSIVLVVAEHGYQRDLSTITVAEIKQLMKKKGNEWGNRYQKLPQELTFYELERCVRDEFSDTHAVQGLSLIELARFMKSLGCDQALNFDGGGSSTLWLNGEVKNKSVGDVDEGNGLHAVRAVSDALIFKKQKNRNKKIMSTGKSNRK